MRMINQEGLDLIKKCENDNDPKSGYRERIINGIIVPYYIAAPDDVGIPTIGFGTIMYPNGKRVALGDPEISQSRAYELLQYEAREKAAAIDSFAINNKFIFTDNQFSALCSLAYNCGIGAVTNHDCTMRAALLSHDTEGIKTAFRLWNKVTKSFFGIKRKVVSNGLVTRREKEIKLFFK